MNKNGQLVGLTFVQYSEILELIAIKNQIKARLLSPDSQLALLAIFSKKEKEVLACVGSDLSTTETARKLHISVSTIQTYRKRIAQKFRANLSHRLPKRLKVYEPKISSTLMVHFALKTGLAKNLFDEPESHNDLQQPTDRQSVNEQLQRPVSRFQSRVAA